MSQRKALIASLVITLVLALSAIGIRAAFFDSPGASADPQSGVTLVSPGTRQYDDDDDDRYEESEHENTYSSNTNQQDDQGDHHESEDSEHEEEHDDD